VADSIRRFDWLEEYAQWLENRLAQYPLWNGAGGVVVTLGGPLIGLTLAGWVLTTLFYPLGLLFSLAILLYCLGPGYLNPQINAYINALKEDDESRIEELARLFSYTGAAVPDEQDIIEGIIIRSNEKLFGVLFWFVVLGPFGAMLYRLTSVMWNRQFNIHGGFTDSVRDLHDILNWPTARLLALGNALSGSMVDAIEAWREVESQSLSVNDAVIRASGLGALNYHSLAEDDEDSTVDDRSYWIASVQGLLNRTLFIWLTVLGLMTIAGWLS
jgi:AmpE protein